jgi:hypothetical protein
MQLSYVHFLFKRSLRSPVVMAPRVFNTNEFKHVEVIDDFANDKRTGDPRVECMYCELQFVGHSTRIRAHLAGSSGVGVAACSEVPEEVKQEMARVTPETVINCHTTMTLISKIPQLCIKHMSYLLG